MEFFVVAVAVASVGPLLWFLRRRPSRLVRLCRHVFDRISRDVEGAVIASFEGTLFRVRSLKQGIEVSLKLPDNAHARQAVPEGIEHRGNLLLIHSNASAAGLIDAKEDLLAARALFDGLSAFERWMRQWREDRDINALSELVINHGTRSEVAVACAQELALQKTYHRTDKEQFLAVVVAQCVEPESVYDRLWGQPMPLYQMLDALRFLTRVSPPTLVSHAQRALSTQEEALIQWGLDVAEQHQLPVADQLNALIAAEHHGALHQADVLGDDKTLDVLLELCSGQSSVEEQAARWLGLLAPAEFLPVVVAAREPLYAESPRAKRLRDVITMIRKRHGVGDSAGALSVSGSADSGGLAVVERHTDGALSLDVAAADQVVVEPAVAEETSELL